MFLFYIYFYKNLIIQKFMKFTGKLQDSDSEYTDILDCKMPPFLK